MEQVLMIMLVAQQQHIEVLEAEVKRLKELNQKPKLKSSKMDQQTNADTNSNSTTPPPSSPPDNAQSNNASDNKPDDGDGNNKNKRNSGPKGSKNQKLKITTVISLPPADLPEEPQAAGWRNKGYKDYLVQELIFEVNVIQYRREVWQRPDGTLAIGELPASIDGHFGPQLKSYVLYQSHHLCTTTPRILKQLRDAGFRLSSGGLSNLLTQEHDLFHFEKDALLTAGIEASDYLQTDDTGARHDGKNGYCTVIANEFFTWFRSTQSKSRINFLTLLQAGKNEYVLNSAALAYMTQQKLPQAPLAQLNDFAMFPDEDAWKTYLSLQGITKMRHVRIVTEGALIGSLIHHGFPPDMLIISDDAGQFNIFNHALCWIHAERNINKLLPLNETHAKQIDWVREVIWGLYADLKRFKTTPELQTEAFKAEILARFDELCRTRTDYMLLNNQLDRLAVNKSELFRVLDNPTLPLHNNLSEQDIREYVTRRKISGSTRSEEGRRCRDTFTSLKKTCGKLGISFWDYLNDRISKTNKIIWLPDAVRNAAANT
jgi:hypothetical protein